MIVRVVPRRDRALWATVKLHPDVVVRAGGVAWRFAETRARYVYVRSGALVLRDASERATGVAGAGDLIGRGGGGPPAARTTVEARALRTSTIVPVPAERVDGALRRGSATLPEVLRALEAQLDRARAIAGGSGRNTAELRLAAVVREAAVRVGEPDAAGGGVVRVEGVTHRILAEWAGLHRSTVTTILNGWLFDDVLAQDGRAFRVPPSGGLPGEGGPGKGGDAERIRTRSVARGGR
jgi:CRP-like cAMP-binding protein